VKLIYLWQIIRLARMPIVLAVIPIFLIGVLFAIRSGASFSPINFLWGFGILFIIEIAAAFANDYYDYEADKHNRQFGFSGGSGVLLEYPELLPFAKWAAVTMFILSLLLTGLFIIAASLPLWAIAYIGVAVFFCWFYTAPPLRLVYRGLGEIPHLLAGIMFPGWGYLILTGTITPDLIIFAVPFGFLGLTVILNFEIPDMEADIHGGKRNLIVIKGRYFSFLLIFYPRSFRFIQANHKSLDNYPDCVSTCVNVIYPTYKKGYQTGRSNEIRYPKCDCWIPFIFSYYDNSFHLTEKFD
jgi:1,4-dihydroxy-2-naphthoate octaprenyltransferase